VEPLPKHGMKPYPYAAGEEYPFDAAHLGYELEYNSRSRSGRMPDELRYNYSRPAEAGSASSPGYVLPSRTSPR
jgi:hypothetical protein